MPMMENKCGCPHHKIIPALVVLFGLLFLLQAVNVVSPELVAIVWPIIVLLAGLMKMAKGACKCCTAK